MSILPVPAVNVSPKAPSTEASKVIVPAPAPVFKAEVAVSVKGDAKLIASFVVVIVPPKEVLPVPFCVKAPSKETTALLEIVRSPELVIVITPFPEVVTL